MASPRLTDPGAGPRYLLLADISGYTAFLNGVEQAHGADFSSGLPAGYEVVGALLGKVIEGVQPAFDIAKLEGDAVFAVAATEGLDGRGDAVVDRLQAVYRAFDVVRETGKSVTDHICTACPVIGSLDLKMVLHRGHAVPQRVGAHLELLGPAVNVAHRLLKNTIHARLGYGPYLFVTDPAATALGLADAGVEHDEHYDDVGDIHGRVIDLAQASQVAVSRTVRLG